MVIRGRPTLTERRQNWILAENVRAQSWNKRDAYDAGDRMVWPSLAVKWQQFDLVGATANNLFWQERFGGRSEVADRIETKGGISGNKDEGSSAGSAESPGRDKYMLWTSSRSASKLILGSGLGAVARPDLKQLWCGNQAMQGTVRGRPCKMKNSF